MPKNAIIVGMPRSGTSMTTSIFVNKGYFIAEDKHAELRAGDEHNPGGYLEAESLINSNAAIFKAASFNHDNTWLYEAITKDQAQTISELARLEAHRELVKKYDTNSPWVWKDPRLCYTLGYWWPLLNPETTGVLLLLREPKHIYQSFIRLQWRKIGLNSKKDVYSRTNDHITFAKEIITKFNIPHITVNYSDFETKPEETARLISNFFELHIDQSDIPYSKKLNHSKLHGRLSTLIDIIISKLPAPFRKIIKSLTPKFIFKLIFPHRNKQ